MQLIQLLNKDSKEEGRISTFLNSIDKVDTNLDPLHIFANFLYKADSIDPSDFKFST